MKTIITFTFRGAEQAVCEHLDVLVFAVEPTILDECDISIRSFTEEELEK